MPDWLRCSLSVCWLACSAWPLTSLGCTPRPQEVRVRRILIDAPPEFDQAVEEREQIRTAVRPNAAAATQNIDQETFAQSPLDDLDHPEPLVI